MPNDSLTRQDYIRALLNQKRTYDVSGNNLVNPMIGGLAELDTSFNGVQQTTKPQQEEKVDTTQKGGFEKFIDNVFGFLDELAAKFGSGYVGAWEGFLDLGATALGAMGWKEAAEWAKQDIGTAASEWVKSTLGLGAIKSGIQGNWGNKDYWNTVGENLVDVLGSGFFVQNKLGDVRADLSDKYYGSNDEVLSQMKVGDWEAGEFLGGIAKSVGSQFAARGLGKAFGAASGAQKGTEAFGRAREFGNLLGLGVGAAGKGSEQALNEGASAGKALGYGAASGSIEVLSEKIVGPILEQAGLGINAVAGQTAKQAGKEISKTATRELAKNIGKAMFEEGMEEVFSALFEPVTQSIYKGKDAFKDNNGKFIYTSPDFWVKGNDSVLGQFASGAVSGGIMSGVSETSMYKKLGKDGYMAAKTFAAASEKAGEAEKLRQQGKGDSAEYKKLCDEVSKLLTKDYTKYVDKLSDKQMKELGGLLNNPQAFKKAMEKDNAEKTNANLKQYIQNISKQTSAELASRPIFNDIQRNANTDVELRTQEGVDANYDPDANIITVDPKVFETEGGKKLLHEYLGHAMSRNISLESQNAIYDKIHNTEDGKFIEEKMDTIEEYKKIKKDSSEYKEEVIAQYLERVFGRETAGKTSIQQLGALNQLVGKKSLIDRFLDLFSGVEKFKSDDAIFNEYTKLLNNFVEATAKNGKTRRIVAIAKKLNDKKELSEDEKKFYDKHKEVIDAVADLKKRGTSEEVKYAKELTYKTDNKGNKLTNDQVEYFVDTKIKDKNGNLLVCYHGTSYSDFNVFDINYSSKGNNYGVGMYFSTNIEDASGYGKPKGNGFYLNITNPITKQSKKITRQQIDVLLNGYELSDDSLYGDIKKFKKNIYKQIGNDLIIYEELSNNVEDKVAFIDKFIETTGYDGVKTYYEGFYELVAFKPNQIKNIDNKTPTTSDDIRYSKDLVAGKYTIGDNNKPLEVRKKSDGKYEVIFPSEGRTITEAQINGKTVKFDSDTNVDEYLKDIKAKRVSREKSESNGKRVKGKKVEALDLTNSNIPTQEEMHKADATKLKRKYKIKNKTVYAGNDGKIEKVYKTKVQKDGSYKVQVKDLASGNVETKLYSPKSLLSELSSYTNVANTEKEVLETYKQAQESKAEQKQVEETKEEKKKTETKKQEVTKKQEKQTFKSVETSKDVVDQSVKYIENELGEGYKIFAPQNTETLVNRAFNAINDVKDVNLEARNLTNLLLQTNVEQLEDNGSYKEVGTLEDLLTKKQTKAIEKAIKQIIKSAPNTEARNNATKFLEMALDKVKNTAKQYKSESGRVRVLVRLRDRIRRNIQRFEEITNTNAEKYGLNVLLQPFEELHSGERTFKAKDFRINLNAALQWYTQENIENNYPELKYDDRIRRALVDVYESLGTPVERGGKMVYGQINADTMQKSIDAIRLINKSIKEMADNHVNKILPAALQTIEAIKRSRYGQNKNVLSRLFRSYKRGFAPAYVVLEDIFGGNSEIARKLTFDFQNAVNSRTLYTGLYHDSINDKLKKLGIKKTLDSTKFNIRGHNITADQAMGLYIALNVEDNYNAIEEDGAVGYDVNSKKYYDLAPKGNAEALKTEIDSILPQQYKDLANWLLQTMNSEVKQDYIDWYKQEYGDYESRNEIGVLGDSSYWVLSRDTRKMSNLEKAMYNPAAVFSRAKSRTNGNGHAVLISGALNTFDTYIEKLGSELFTKPVYREAQQMLNTKQKGGKSVYETISERDNGALDVKYVQDTMADMVGALQSNRDFLDKLIGSFSVAKLSLNIGSMMKQFASVWTSNIPIRKSTKAILSKMFNSEFKKEYKMLIEGIKKASGEWDLEPIGGLKYREASKGILTANADSMFGIARKVAKGGMWGISKMDLMAINTGVYSLMVIGQDQYKLKIGTRENAEFVKEHWTEFELSQIGSSALSKNYVSRGENVSRYIFGFLQGANRAALGSQLHKAGLWNRNRGVNETQLKNDLKVAKENTIKAEMAYNANPDSEQLRNEYIKAKTTELDLENRLKDYQSYKIAGGGAIPVNMAAGILAQGIFITLINAFMKWIKGRKDPDEYELAEESMNLAYAVFADWVPMVNALVNLFKGYEVSVPATNILNQFKDIIQNAKKGNFKSTAMDIAVLLGDMTGIPVETLYGYIYGTIKKFDPAAAYEMNSVLYGSSLQSASKTLNNYVDKNNVGKSAMMVGIIMEDYKTGSTNDKINREIAQLKIDGYNAMPSGVPETVRDSKGAEIELDAKQIKQFKDYYSQSTKDVTNMLDITDYKKATAEERSKMLSKLYNAYYEYAKSRVGGAKPTNKLASILVATNGNVALAKYILSLEKISTITDTKKKTRKELVLQYVNKLRGFTKGEKAMLMYLAGYKVSGKSRNQLVSYLVKNGCKRKEAVKLVDGISD